MQYRNDKYGNPLSILGFGCMRFSKKGNAIDIDKAEKEIMAAYRNGVNYFDTAYVYPMLLYPGEIHGIPGRMSGLL